MNNLCVIPARGGSKRISRKNVKDFLGKPIIAYSIEAAQQTGLFDDIMVSTDDEEIARTSENYGACIPFLRSQENANDHAGLADVLVEVMTTYKNNNKVFDNICCILPTAPLTTPLRIKEAYHLLIHGNWDSVVPVVEFSYPIFRALEYGEKERIKMIWPEYLYSRSQDLKPAYHDSGSFYWVKWDAFLSERKFFCTNGTGIVVSELEVQDIDTMTDWKMAELKYESTRAACR